MMIIQSARAKNNCIIIIYKISDTARHGSASAKETIHPKVRVVVTHVSSLEEAAIMRGHKIPN